MKVAALTSGKLVPSTRFRVRQHIAPLRTFGVNVVEYCPQIDKYAPMPGFPPDFAVSLRRHIPFWQAAKVAVRLPGIIGSRRSDVTWLQRELLPGYPTLELLLKRPLVFDLDDAIWLARPFGERAVATIAKRASVVVAGNQYLGDWCSSYADDVRVVPTAIDTDRFCPAPEGKTHREDFIIGWTGSAPNVPYLEAIAPALERFFRDFDNAKLLVIADRRPQFQGISGERIDFIPWSPEIEVKALQQVSVGLMPLPDDDWTRGKCSFKMLQYMACGIPVLASPVGMNCEIMEKGFLGIAASDQADWYEALEFFARNSSAAKTAGRRGRAVAEEYYSRSAISRRLAEIFHDLA